MPDLQAPQTGISRVPRAYWSGWRLVALGIVALVLVCAGVTWRMGWFPFSLMSREASMQDAVTAPGPSTLSPEELSALLKQTSAAGSSKLTPAEQEALVRATSVE